MIENENRYKSKIHIMSGKHCLMNIPKEASVEKCFIIPSRRLATPSSESVLMNNIPAINDAKVTSENWKIIFCFSRLICFLLCKLVNFKPSPPYHTLVFYAIRRKYITHTYLTRPLC